MAYAQIEFDFWSNPKVLAAGKDAALLYIASCGHCSQHLTDGFIAESAIPFIANMAWQRSYKKQVSALVENGLWLKVEGGYKINDYLKHNKSKAEVAEYREKKSKAGKASAEARGGQNSNTRSTGVGARVDGSVEQAFNYDYDDVNNYKRTTTTPPLPPSEFERKIAGFCDIYAKQFGKQPKMDADEPDKIIAMFQDGVTEEEFTVAIQEMDEKGFTCSGISSARNWIINNRSSKKRQPGNSSGRAKPDLGDYKISRLSEVVIE